MNASLSRLKIIVFAAIAVSALPPPQAHAGKMFFGADEKLHVIAPTEMKSSSGAPLYLCFKTYSYFFVAGLYATSERVICDGELSKSYWPMPEPARLKEFQAAGLVPDPLPDYQVDTIEYIFGYSMWILIAAIALFTYFSSKREKAEAVKNAELLKTTARRAMAHMAASAHYTSDLSSKIAHEIFQGLFSEPLSPEDFAADIAWVRTNGPAYDGFIKAMSRKFDNGAKVVLLRAAAYIVMADGNMDEGEEKAIAHLAGLLGMKPADVTDFLATLRTQQAAVPPPAA